MGEAGRRSTAAARCGQEENVPVISQHWYRQKKKTVKRKEKKRKGKKRAKL